MYICCTYLFPCIWYGGFVRMQCVYVDVLYMVYLCMYSCVCVHVCICLFPHVCMYLCCMYMYVCMLYVCVYVCFVIIMYFTDDAMQCKLSSAINIYLSISIIAHAKPYKLYQCLSPHGFADIIKTLFYIKYKLLQM